MAVTKKFPILLLLGIAFLVGLAAAVAGLESKVLVAIFGSMFLLWIAFERKKSTKSEVDPGEWQRQIEREYRIDIDGNFINVFRNGALEENFEWKNLIEIQHIQNERPFPPLLWKIITKDGQYLVPSGGSCTREFCQKFIYSLPEYYDQQTVSINGVGGSYIGNSMWRKEDPYPKREPNDEEIEW